MALVATGGPSRLRNRRNCAPKYVSLARKVLAAIFKALVARLLVGMRPFPMTLPPLILLSGLSLSQETKWFSVFHLLISPPTSLRTVIAVMTSMPSIRVRSVPVMRNKSCRRSNCGVLPFSSSFVLSASLSAEWPLDSDPPFAPDTAPVADRTRRFASGKTHIPSAPAAAQTADRLANCPPAPARSPLRWPSPEHPDTPPARVHRVPHPESP